nr:exported hypothetical protein [Serratia symbiotica]
MNASVLAAQLFGPSVGLTPSGPLHAAFKFIRNHILVIAFAAFKSVPERFVPADLSPQ